MRREKPAVPRAIDGVNRSFIMHFVEAIGRGVRRRPPPIRHAAAHFANHPQPKWRRDARALPARRACLALPPVRGDRGGRRLRGRLGGGHPPLPLPPRATRAPRRRGARAQRRRRPCPRADPVLHRRRLPARGKRAGARRRHAGARRPRGRGRRHLYPGAGRPAVLQSLPVGVHPLLRDARHEPGLPRHARARDSRRGLPRAAAASARTSCRSWRTWSSAIGCAATATGW